MNIPENTAARHLPAFFRVDSPQPRIHGGVGLETVAGVGDREAPRRREVLVGKSTEEEGTTMRFAFPAEEGIAAMDRRAVGNAGE